MITLKEFLESKKYENDLSNEELAVKSGISVESLRSIFKGELVSQLILRKVMTAYRISIYNGKKLFKDFYTTRETLKGIRYYDYDLGKQKAMIESAEIVENNRKSIRLVLKNKYTYVTTIPVYDKIFSEFENSFNINIIENGLKSIIGKIGEIYVVDDGTDILQISFRSESDE